MPPSPLPKRAATFATTLIDFNLSYEAMHEIESEIGGEIAIATPRGAELCAAQPHTRRRAGTLPYLPPEVLAQVRECMYKCEYKYK